MLPNDANMLFSYINMKLRDFYPSLDDFCEDTGEDKGAIEEKLSAIGCRYDVKKNQFSQI